MNRKSIRSACLLLMAGAMTNGWLSAQDNCTQAKAQLENLVREKPESAPESVEAAVRAHPKCAAELVSAAILVADANSEVVSRIVASAVQAVPNEAVAIAESAIAAAPGASDAVATVVQNVLGDCESIGQDLAQNAAKSPGKLLFILEDALRAHENCACEIVKSSLEAAKGDKKVIEQLVQLAVNVAPAKAAEIAECAISVAPTAAAEINRGMDAALADKKRGKGAAAAAAKVEEAPPVEEVGEGDQSSSTEPRRTKAPRYSGKGNGEVSHGKGNGQVSSGKGKGGAVEVAPVDEAEQWWSLPGRGPNVAPVYLIAPSGGIVPAGELVPISPNEPHIKYPNHIK